MITHCLINCFLDTVYDEVYIARILTDDMFCGLMHSSEKFMGRGHMLTRLPMLLEVLSD